MNKYALMARDHWEQYAPSQVEELETPTEFFTKLGEEAEAQVQQIESHLEASLPSDLPYLEKVAQLRAITKQAEDAVLPELIYSVTPDQGSAEELDKLLGELPGWQGISSAIGMIEQQAFSQETGEYLPDQEQEHEMEVLNQLDQLLRTIPDPYEMTPEDVEPKLQELKSFVLKHRQILDPRHELQL